MTNHAARRKARHYAMQSLYQWHMTGQNPAMIVREFQADYDMTHVDKEYLHTLVTEVVNQQPVLDEQFAPHLIDRAMKELDPITLALLRMATYELQSRIEVPFKVVINEAVALAKKFGATDSHKFVNGVLDRTADQLRAVEKAQ